jgi:hypothetical protein
MNRVIKVYIKDGLGFSSGFVTYADYTCVIYCKVPESWIENGNLKKGREEIILGKMYGPGWRMGNEDGSHYVVSTFEANVLDDLQVFEKIWLQDNKEDRSYRYWYYQVSDTGEVNNVKISEF